MLKVREQVFPGIEVFWDVSLDPENLVFLSMLQCLESHSVETE